MHATKAWKESEGQFGKDKDRRLTMIQPTEPIALQDSEGGLSFRRDALSVRRPSASSSAAACASFFFSADLYARSRSLDLRSTSAASNACADGGCRGVSCPSI